ncbi:MAG TPA: glycoside hydrolase domain-containing protein, partial [Aggregatilineales bacterium]|nr:glycoside hydrolase domain-containing protein [Aggregatilineales bacterium]
MKRFTDAFLSRFLADLWKDRGKTTVIVVGLLLLSVVIHLTTANAQEVTIQKSNPSQFNVVSAPLPNFPISSSQTVSGPIANVDPFIGTGGAIHDFPGAIVPFGMVSISPDTNLAHAGGFNYGDPDIMGFSQVHEEGVGCADLGNILIVPTTGGIATSESGYQSPYNNLAASPGYFRATLTNSGTTAEMTATIHASYNQYTFPARNGDANILIDVTHALSPYVQGGTVNVISPTEVQGWATSGHRCGHSNLQTVYFDAQFSKAATKIGTWLNGVTSTASSQTGQHVGAYFSTTTAANEVITVKIGVSYTSVANAVLNVNTEIPAGTTFNQILTNAQNAWNTELSKITVGGGTSDQQKEFYTALYHSLMIPNVLSDVNGQYPGPNNSGVKTAAGYVQYDFFNTWDQQRSNFALLALGWPERLSDMMKSVDA